MTLTSEQVKQAKKICKENGLDVKLVNKNLGNGFWIEECNSSFEGYIAYLLNKAPYLGGTIDAIMEKSLNNYRNGKSGLSSLNK